MFERVIRGGLAALPDRVALVDLAIEGERIAAIGDPGSLRGVEVVDADGLLVLPGGVDPHVHLDTQFGEWRTTDDFWTGGAAAALGGTTTIIEFAIPRPGETTESALRRCLAEAQADAAVDFGLHACVTRESFRESLDQLGGLRTRGVGSVKVFSAYGDSIGLSPAEIDEVLHRAEAADLLVLVHAEDDVLIDRGVRVQLAAGQLGPRGHADSRPPEAEAKAIDEISAMARAAAARVFFVHVSSAAGAEAVRRARLAGGRVGAETCVQYLLLDDTVYDGPDGELWICSPPLRGAVDQTALWTALADGTLDLISTDHNCFDRAQKLSQREDFRAIPNGLPGVELRLPALLGEVASGRLGWHDLARLASAAPARQFGLWPRKGCIAPGSDADLVLVDPASRTDLGVSHMATDYSPLAGLSAAGAIVQTWLRGRQVVAAGRFVGERGQGARLGCASPALA